MKRIPLKEIAYGRSGDKGNISNVFLIPYRGNDYALLLEKVTVAFAEEVFDGLVDGSIERYEFPGVKGINFVMYEALQGGVSRSLGLDTHGKSRHTLFLDAKIEVSDDYEPPETIDGEKEWIRS